MSHFGGFRSKGTVRHGPVFGLCLALLLAQCNSPVAIAQTPSWQAEVVKAIVRIESRRCVGGPCRDGADDRLARTGTGFLVKLDGFPSPVLVTALHVVAGANNVTYEFTEVDRTKHLTQVLSADLGADVAILAVDQRYSSLIKPLRLSLGENERRDVIVYGHKLGATAIISDEGKVKLKAPSLLSQMPFDQKERDLIRTIGYPDIDLPVVSLEGILNPGDSGAPILNLEGELVGMAHGGIPASAARLAWMIPANRLASLRHDRIAIAKLKEFTTKHTYSVVSAFYSKTILRTTEFGTIPGLSFGLQWPVTAAPLRAYATRLAERSRRDYRWLNEGAGQVRHARRINPEEDAFPANVADAPGQSCTEDPSNALCASSRRSEQLLLQVLSALVVRVTCYRSSVMDQLVASKDARPPFQPDLLLELPIGDLRRRIAQQELELAYEWAGVGISQIYLSTRGFLNYNPGVGKYQRHPNIEYLEDLHGGACQLTLGSADPKFHEEVAALERALRTGGACLHLILAPQTHSPVAATAYLPLQEWSDTGQLWGVLPLGHQNGPIDDHRCQ